MSVLKTFNIALDTKKALYGDRITLVESDTGNRFVITLTDDGDPVDLTGCRVAVVFSGAMGTAMQTSWSGTGQVTIGGDDDNEITVDVLPASYANGLVTCEIQVYSGESYTTLVTSAAFTFNGRKPIVDENTLESSTEYPILVELINQVEGLATREQSDWDQTDDTKGNFIQNKPVVGTNFQDATQNLTEEATLSDADAVPFYDASATAHRKSTWSNIIAKIRTAFFGSVTGVAKLDGAGNVSAAAANTDFAAATHASRHASGAADAVTPAAIGAQAAMTGGVDYVLPDLIVKLGGTGVYSGSLVSAHGSPDQAIYVASGIVITPLGVPRSFDTVDSLSATAADATHPRIDVVYVASDGVVTYLAGTAAASPTQPATPTNGTILAAITRAANDNTIASSDIADQRDFITIPSDFEDVVSVTESSNTFTCNLSRRHTKNFSFTIADTNAKTVVFIGSPYGTCDSILTIKATATAAVTWTLDGRTLVWPAGAPTLTSGFTYDILFSYVPLLGKWVGRAQLGAAN